MSENKVETDPDSKAVGGEGDPAVLAKYGAMTPIEDLPEDFQTAEFVRDHGGIDLVVERKYLRSTISTLLSILLKKKETQAISSSDNAIFEETLSKTAKGI